MKGPTVKFRAVVDAIEEGIARVIPRDGEAAAIVWPAVRLPESAREGDILAITVEIDRAATEEATRRVSDLIDELDRMSRGQ